MAPSRPSLVQKKGQVTIPVSLRRRLGLKTGDSVAFSETAQGVFITPPKVAAMAALDRIGHAALVMDWSTTLRRTLGPSAAARSGSPFDWLDTWPPA